jgi:hypothetical protein
MVIESHRAVKTSSGSTAKGAKARTVGGGPAKSKRKPETGTPASQGSWPSSQAWAAR